jgi:membrane protease YdiL (CAAX protease family)
VDKEKKTETIQSKEQSLPWYQKVGKYLNEKFHYFVKNPLHIFWNPQEDRVRSLERIIIFIMVMLLSTMGVTLVLSLIAQGLYSGQDLTTSTIPTNVFIVEMIMQVLMYLAPVFITLWVMAKYFDKRSIIDFGFRLRKRWWLDLIFGLALGSLLMAIIFLIERAFGWIQVVSHNTNAIYPIPFILGIIAEVFLFIGVAIFEEGIVRGYLLRNMAEGFHWGKITGKVAVLISFVITSVVFGFLHNSNPSITWLGIVNLGISGLFLGLGYILAGDLAIPIGLHVAWNIFQGTVFGFPVSGMTAAVSVLRVFQTGPALITGGEFGPEGGLLVLFIFIVGAGMIYYYLKLTRNTAQIETGLANYVPMVKPVEKKLVPAEVERKKTTRSKKVE